MRQMQAKKKGNENGKTQTRQHVCVCVEMYGKAGGKNQRKSLAEKANVQCVCKKGVVVVIVSTSSLSFPLSIRLTHSAARLAHSQLQSSNVK